MDIEITNTEEGYCRTADVASVRRYQNSLCGYALYRSKGCRGYVPLWPHMKNIFFLEKGIDKSGQMMYYNIRRREKRRQGEKKNGSIAQLGEHLPYKQRVIGSSPIVPTIHGPVVQLVRTLACHARGRRFEPVPGRHFMPL